ncbi:MAG TPA: LysR family transcriptional regulator [Xanthobacteraceae bacterium]|jgi:DNA-binding transcriptional LysR family regulator
MPRRINWESQIGRRMQLRQLHVFMAVIQHGSLAMAARQLGVSTPTVSEVIADLEHVVGVRLLDRSAKGVEPTRYGHTLHQRALIAFDELKQSIADIETLSDPTAGEIRIACPLGIAFSIVPRLFERFVNENPKVVLHFDEVATSATTSDLRGLRERRYDLILGRGGLSTHEAPAKDLEIETLFNDRLVIVAGAESKWVRRRKIDLADLVDEPWIMQEAETGNYRLLARAFQARGLPLPNANLVTLSMSVITHFLDRGPYLTAIPYSVAFCSSLRALPVDLPIAAWPVNVVTLRRRILSPVAERFIRCAREVVRPLGERPARSARFGAPTSS